MTEKLSSTYNNVQNGAKKHSSLKQMLFVIERLNIAVNDFIIYAQSVLTFHTLC